MKKLVFLITFLLSLPVNAQLDLEPYLGYEFGQWSTKNSTSSDSGDSVGPAEGFGYGAKLMYGSKNIYLGLDYYLSTVAWNYSDDPNYADDDDWANTTANKTSISYIAGFRSSDGTLGLWVGMSYQDELSLDKNTIPGKSPPKYTGTFTTFGASYIMNKVKLGLELRQHKYNKVSAGGSTETSTPTSIESVTYNELSHSYYLFTVSLPINIMGGGGGGSSGASADIPGA